MMEPCTECNTGLVHSVCYSQKDLPQWHEDESELVNRVEELELRLEEMWERMKQFERVMSTAFRLHAENELHRCT